MPETLHFRRQEMAFVPFGGPPGSASIARLVGPEASRTMGVGLARFDDCQVQWTVLYDEMIVVLEGVFRLGVGGSEDDSRVIEAHPGDVVWIPEKTPVVYMGDRALVCYALHPVDWRQRHGLG
jgi:ethanolamine utilization protein EutQ